MQGQHSEKIESDTEKSGLNIWIIKKKLVPLHEEFCLNYNIAKEVFRK